MVCLGGSVRWSRHRKEEGVPRKLSGSVGWSRHRKDGVPRNLLRLQYGLGAGKMARLGSFAAQ